MMSVMAVNTLLYSNITCHESGKPLCGSFSEPERDILPRTHSRPRSQPIDGHNKAHCKPDQAPNKRCNQLWVQSALSKAPATVRAALVNRINGPTNTRK